MDILDMIEAEANANTANVEESTEQSNVETQNTDVATQTETSSESETVSAPQEAPINIETATETKVESKQSVFASDKVAELNAYLARNPDKDISDWQKLKTPTSEIDEKELLKQYFSDKEKMTDKEIEYKMKEMETDEFEDDFGDVDEKEKLKREAEYERQLRDAREWREAYVAEQLSAGENAETPVETAETETVRIEDLQKQWAQQQEQARKSYLENIYKGLSDTKSFENNVNGKVVDFIPDTEFAASLKEVSENPDVLWSRFQNEDGSLKDTKGWLDMVSWANESTRNARISAIVSAAIEEDRRTRNEQRRNLTTAPSAGLPANATGEDDFMEFFAEKRKNQF